MFVRLPQGSMVLAYVSPQLGPVVSPPQPMPKAWPLLTLRPPSSLHSGCRIGGSRCALGRFSLSRWPCVCQFPFPFTQTRPALQPVQCLEQLRQVLLDLTNPVGSHI